MVLAIVMGSLFLLLFISKRRLGVAALALVAGSVMANLWSHSISQLITRLGVTFTTFPLEGLVTVVLVVLPVILILPSAQSYHSKLLRMAAALLFAALGASLLLPQFEASVIISGSGKTLYDILSQNRSSIITAGIVVALVDLFLTRAKHTARLHDRH